ncbi:MAG: phosphoglycerate dehydrogenase [Thermoplasmata archaeon]|nr:phosphoglycerate dehydrogenase [Thermoplasmata archaeon]
MKVLITDEVAEEAINKLKEKHEVVYKELRGEELAKEIPEYDALMVRSGTKVTADIIEKAEKLKVIGRAGIGVDNIDVEAASRKGIYVVNAPSGSTISVAELVIGHMLSLARHLPKADYTLKHGEWAKKKLKGIEIYGKTLGIIGLGRIGRAVAERAKAMGMNVIGYDPYIKECEVAEMMPFEEVLKKADFVTIHVPLTEETRHIIGSRELEMMKNTAYLINCARGGVVDENALYEALANGKIAGAALDVFEKEPPEGSKLLELGNIVVSPHIGASTKEGQIRAGVICAEQIMKVLDGVEPDFWVNRNMMK